jgi:hypothetical protein
MPAQFARANVKFEGPERKRRTWVENILRVYTYIAHTIVMEKWGKHDTTC